MWKLSNVYSLIQTELMHCFKFPTVINGEYIVIILQTQEKLIYIWVKPSRLKIHETYLNVCLLIFLARNYILARNQKSSGRRIYTEEQRMNIGSCSVLLSAGIKNIYFTWKLTMVIEHELLQLNRWWIFGHAKMKHVHV